MEVYRIATDAYARELSASGSANRWNRKGQLVLYAGSSRSLSTLELVVHRGSIIPTLTYKVMIISLSEEDRLFRQVQIGELPEGWRTMGAYAALQKMGADWYTSAETLVLKVPSVIIPQEYNYIINTEHPDFNRKVQLVRVEDYFWDNRLF